MYAISLGGVANTVPFITLSPVVSVLIGMPINGEYPSSFGIFCVLMICTGAAALALARASEAAQTRSDTTEAEGESSPGIKPAKPVLSPEEAASKSSDEVRGILCMMVPNP